MSMGERGRGVEQREGVGVGQDRQATQEVVGDGVDGRRGTEAGGHKENGHREEAGNTSGVGQGVGRQRTEAGGWEGTKKKQTARGEKGQATRCG